MIEVILVEPEIPQNTGNIARTCLAIGAKLILVRPLAFSLCDKFIRRAGMDYWNKVDVEVVDSLECHIANKPIESLMFLSTKGKQAYYQAAFSENTVLIFGSESKGLDKKIHEQYADNFYTIPMFSKHIRSLNLATSVGIVAYESVKCLLCNT